jgi:hypothetical protein
MKTLRIKISLALTAIGVSLNRLFSPRGSIALANELGEMFPDGRKSMIIAANAALPVSGKYLLYKKSVDDNHVDVCGVGDFPLGNSPDSPKAIGDMLTINLLGAVKGTSIGVASGALAFDDLVVPGALGTVRKLPVAAGTYWIIGRAIKGVADGVEAPYIPCFPIQRVVP